MPPRPRIIPLPPSLRCCCSTPPAESYLRTLRLWPDVAREVEDRRPRLSEWLSKRPELAGDKDAQALLLRLLEADPRKRMGAREALQVPWFTRAEPRLNRERPWELCQAPARVSEGAGFKAGVDHHEYSSRVRRKSSAAPGAEGGGGGAGGAASAPPPPLPPASSAAAAAAAAADAVSASVASLDEFVRSALALPCDAPGDLPVAAASLQHVAAHLTHQLQRLAAAAPAARSAAAGGGGSYSGADLESRVSRYHNAVHERLSAVLARLAAAASSAPAAGAGGGGGGGRPAHAHGIYDGALGAPPAGGGPSAQPLPRLAGSRWGERAAGGGDGAGTAGGLLTTNGRRGRSRSRSPAQQYPRSPGRHRG